MPEVMEAFFRAIARIALREPRQLLEVPAVEDGADEAVAQERERAIDENATIERENEELGRWQTRVRFAWPEPEKQTEGVAEGEEGDAEVQSAPKEVIPKTPEQEVDATAFVRIQNYRDPPVIEGSVQSQEVRETSQMKTGGDTDRVTNVEKDTVVETNRQSVE